MKGEALNNTLADTPPEEKAEILGETIGDVKVKPLVDTFPDNLRLTNAETNLDTLGGVRARALVDTIAETLQDAKPRHLSKHWTI